MFNGCVELVKSGVMHERDNVSLVPDILRFKGYTDRLYDFLIGLKGLDVPAPFLVHAAILGCADGIVDAGKSFASRDYVGVSIYQLGKDVVLLPEVVLNEFPADKNDFQTMLKPIGDGLFNASGMPQHNGYDDEGKWPQ